MDPLSSPRPSSPLSSSPPSTSPRLSSHSKMSSSSPRITPADGAGDLPVPSSQHLAPSTPTRSSRNSAASSPATSRHSLSPSATPRASRPGRPNASPSESGRSTSFKRRAAADASPQGSNRLSTIIHNASFGALGRPSDPRLPRKSFAGSSIAGVSSSGWRRDRRALSVQAPVSGDPEDPSSWSFAEPKPHYPSPIQKAPDATPIPLVPFTVLCLVCFGEFSSSGVAGPFLFFMIDGFHVGGESDVGFWAGIVASCFFLAQFLTSLLWASTAEKYGRRSVLLASLIGNACTLIAFGTSTNLKMAITVRMAQGLFNGAVGVAKGAIRDLTDSSNESRAYAIMGFAWGFGGILGPIMGGVLEHPATKFPGLFGNVELFKTYPYLLPCMTGAMFTSLGAFLSLFVGPDGGPRQGTIKLEGAEGEEDPAAAARPANSIAAGVENVGRTVSKRVSGYFSQDTEPAGASQISLERTQHAASSSQSHPAGLPRTFTQQVDDETGGPASAPESEMGSDEEGTVVTRRQSDWDPRLASNFTSGADRSMSRTEERHRGILGGGSAYGYEPGMRRASRSSAMNGSQEFARARRGRAHLLGRWEAAGSNNPRASVAMGSAFDYAPDFEAVGEDPALAPAPRQLNFAERFLLANDDAVMSITDLWVAAAINGDEAYSVLEEDVSYDDDAELLDDNDDLGANDSQVLDADSSAGEQDDDEEEDQAEGPASSNRGSTRPYLPPMNFAQRRLSRNIAGRSEMGGSSGLFPPRSIRLGSYGGRVPSLYNNTGLDLPSPRERENPWQSFGEAMRSPAGESRTAQYDPILAGIPESDTARNTLRRQEGIVSAAVQEVEEQQQKMPEKAPPSIWSLLPLTIIAHYALLAFHSATFDQVFMAFLVTPYPSGGLGLTAAHFAELISAMAFCQIGFQFYVYPKLNSRFSHLAIMRIGTLLYLPTYTLFPLLRNFKTPGEETEKNTLVMTFMILFASMRWLANICAFTSVSILMNATTPPNLVPLANGLAQTITSAGRFIGPLIGGVVWARGIAGGYEMHTWPFNYHEGFWFVGLVAFSGFLHCLFLLKAAAQAS